MHVCNDMRCGKGRPEARTGRGQRRRTIATLDGNAAASAVAPGTAKGRGRRTAADAARAEGGVGSRSVIARRPGDASSVYSASTRSYQRKTPASIGKGKADDANAYSRLALDYTRGTGQPRNAARDGDDSESSSVCYGSGGRDADSAVRSLTSNNDLHQAPVRTLPAFSGSYTGPTATSAAPSLSLAGFFLNFSLGSYYQLQPTLGSK